MARSESPQRAAHWGWLPNDQAPEEFYIETAIAIPGPNNTVMYVPIDRIIFTEEDLQKLRLSVNRLHAAKAMPKDNGHKVLEKG